MDKSFFLENEVVFVVGASFEAAELEDEGFPAISATTDTVEDVWHVVEQMKNKPVLILQMLDEENEAWAKALRKRGIPYVLSDGTREEEELFEDAKKRMTTLRDEASRYVLSRLNVHTPMDTVINLGAGGHAKATIPTGIRKLDDVMGGGFRRGELITLGAVSSVGKTTLALQVADHVASTGHTVLFVTVEQGREELVAKSLSRLTAESGEGYVLGSGEIMRGEQAGKDTPYGEALTKACLKYAKDIAPNLWIYESEEQPTVEDVRRAVTALKTDEAPFVVVDYLQLLKSTDTRLSDKQATDINVMALRHMARDMETAVLVISSLNRSSYSEGVTLESFKESGAIEYGSDVLLGLQPFGFTNTMSSVPETKTKRTSRDVYNMMKKERMRKCELIVLKNRNGGFPKNPIGFDYDALGNHFKEM